MMAREDNAFNMRRFANIFNPRQEDPLMGAYRKIDFNRPSTAPSPISGPSSEEADNDPLSLALKRLQGGQASAAYREHLGKLPTREEYAPSQTRRIGGALAAAAAGFNDVKTGLAIGDQITNAPYRNAMESWQNKGAGLSEQAQMESQDVKSQIEYIKRIQEQQREARTEARDTRRLDIDEENANTTRMYRQAQIENFKTQGFREVTDPQGNMILVHPDGRRMDMGPTMAGREQENRERATNISAYGAETGRINANTGIGNLNLRGDEFNYRQGQDAILNEDRATGRDIQQQNTDIARQNAGAAGLVPAGEQYGADAMAGQAVVREHPEWSGWFDSDGKLKAQGDFWMHTPDPRAYAAAVAAVEQKKQQILGTRRPGVGSVPGGRVRAPTLGGMGGGPLNFNDLPD